MRDILPGIPPRLRQARKRWAAATIDCAILTALIAIPVLGAVVATGDRVRSLFVATEETLGDGVAGLPLPETPGGAAGGPPPAPPDGQLLLPGASVRLHLARLP